MTSSNITIIDIGDMVLCDLCNADYTDSEAGILMGTYSICPTCAPGSSAVRSAPASSSAALHRHASALGASTQRRQEYHRDHRLLSVTVFMAPREALSSRFFTNVSSLSFAAVPRLVRGGEQAAPGRAFPSPRLLSPFRAPGPLPAS